MEFISQFNDHVSTKKIKQSYSIIIPDAFTFSPVSLGDVQKEIKNLDVKKLLSSKSINTSNNVKVISYIYLTLLTNSIILFVRILFQII